MGDCSMVISTEYLHARPEVRHAVQFEAMDASALCVRMMAVCVYGAV